MTKRVPLLCACLLSACLLTPLSVRAIDTAPFHFANAAVADNSEAAEVLTIRAHANGQGDTFIRVAIVNAGFQNGELKLNFRQESSQGTFYGEQSFARGDYQLGRDRLQLRAGKHTLEIKSGVLVGQLDFPSGLQATFTLLPHTGSLRAQDRGNGGYIFRNLLVPMGKLTVHASDASRKLEGLAATGFALHDVSTCSATKVYDRALQLYRLTAGSYLMLDYIVGPSERSHRPLGFLVASGGGKLVAAEVVKETREAEKVDDKNDYRVPWQVTVLGKHGDARAAIRAVAERQLAREDDLAGLSWVARKAVGALFHPYAYLLKGSANVELQTAPAEAAVTFDTGVRYKYSQGRE
jgi:hypothetical protein